MRLGGEADRWPAQDVDGGRMWTAVHGGHKQRRTPWSGTIGAILVAWRSGVARDVGCGPCTCAVTGVERICVCVWCVICGRCSMWELRWGHAWRAVACGTDCAALYAPRRGIDRSCEPGPIGHADSVCVRAGRSWAGPGVCGVSERRRADPDAHGTSVRSASHALTAVGVGTPVRPGAEKETSCRSFPFFRAVVHLRRLRTQSKANMKSSRSTQTPPSHPQAG